MGQDQSTQQGGNNSNNSNNSNNNNNGNSNNNTNKLAPSQQQQHADPAFSSSVSVSRESSASPRPNRQQALLNFASLDSSSTGGTGSSFSQQQQSSAVSNAPKAFESDDEVLAIWRQLECISIRPPILHTTSLTPEQEIAALVTQQQLHSSSSSSLTPSSRTTTTNTSKDSTSSNGNNNNNSNNASQRESSPTLESISNFISELKRKAQSASKEIMATPNFRERSGEIKSRLQKPSGATSPTPTASPAPSVGRSAVAASEEANVSRAASPSSTATNSSSSTSSSSTSSNNNNNNDKTDNNDRSVIISGSSNSGGGSNGNGNNNNNSSASSMALLLKSPLPILPQQPLLQALGRAQTLCLKEISNTAVPRCERATQDAVKLYQELQGLKSGALQQVRHGQKCYAVETEVKRLHMELHGDERGSAAAKSIGHEGAFVPLTQICDETGSLLDKIHSLLGEEPRRKLQEYAAGIDARALVKSPTMASPAKTASAKRF